MAKKKLVPFEFDSPECAAVAHDLAIIQLADADRGELNFSVGDLELLIGIARGKFDLGTERELNDETS